MIVRDSSIEDRLQLAAAPRGAGLAAWLPAGAFALALGYALVRYVLVKEVAAAHIPLYIANKAFAVAGIALLALTSAAQPLARRLELDVRVLRRRLGAHACLFVGLHVALSLAILRPSYFAGFFAADGTLGGRAELALLLGVVAGLAMITLAAPTWRAALGGVWSQVAFTSSAALWFAALHVFVMGVPGWLRPADWPGYLPPITLLAFLIAIAGVIAKRAR